MSRVAFWTLSLLAFCVGLYGLAYFTGLPFRIPGPSAAHFFEYRHLLYGHVLGGGVSLLTGPWQFSAALRRKRPQLHRTLGYIYCFAVLGGGIFGLAMAFFSMAGWVTHLGFGFLALAWMFATVQAVRFARAGNFPRHQMWMIRSFALSLAAVSLRIYLPLLIWQLGFDTGYRVVSWLCWVPNLAAAEWIVANKVPGSGKLQSTFAAQ
jgi:uncharacterized membrane protein